MLLLGRERNEDVVQELLSLARVLLTGVTLETMDTFSSSSSASSSSHVVARLGSSNSGGGSGSQQRPRSSPSKDSKAQSQSSIVHKWNVEDAAFVVLYHIMILAGEFSISSPSVNSSVYAIQWLNEFR